MKMGRLLLAATCLLIGAASAAWAHSPRAHVGVYFGPVWGPWGYPAPWYYPPVTVLPTPAPPPVYIEQAPALVEPAPAYWYYCPGKRAYYPYVQSCPEGWQPVPPRPGK